MNKYDIQDKQYAFPYHYIPHLDANGYGIRLRHLPWGFEYLCYQLHVKEIVETLQPLSVLEVGCGDGFFIGQLGGCIKRRVGVDLSERAISFACAFHPEVEFYAVNAAELDEKFDAVAAIEVLEHIADAETGKFILTLSERTKTGGHVVLSVPTTAVPPQEKHYRHYDMSLLEREVKSSGAPLEIKSVEYVYRLNVVTKLYNRFTNNAIWIMELHPVRKMIWSYTWERLRIADQKNGRHLVVVLEKMSS